MVDIIGQVMATFEGIANMFAPGLSQAGVSWQVFWLVFFLSYVLVYSLLNYVHFLKDNQNAKLVVGLVLAFIISSNSWALALIAGIFPSLGVLLAVGLGLLIIVAVFLPKMLEEKEWKWMKYAAIVFIFIYIISVTFTSYDILSATSGGSGAGEGLGSIVEEYIGVVVVVFVIIGLVAFLKGGSGGSSSSGGGPTFKFMGG